jgi:hypothetical protein
LGHPTGLLHGNPLENDVASLTLGVSVSRTTPGAQAPTVASVRRWDDPGRAIRAVMLALTATAVITASSSGLAGAATPRLFATPNWSGYVAQGRSGHSAEFRSATGTWTVPAVRCSARDARASGAVWVGLGGWKQAEKDKLEHIGTDSNCTDNGRPLYFGWFEVNRFLAYRIPNTLRPGDTVTATVTVLRGARVALELNDETRSWIFARTISAYGQQAASAEWIVSAPENCIQTTCVLTRLPDLDTVSFTGISAKAGSVSGTLTRADWRAIAVELVPGTTGKVDPPELATSPRILGRATPGPLLAGGSAFDVVPR